MRCAIRLLVFATLGLGLPAGCAPRGARPIQGYVEADYVYPAAPFAGRVLARPIVRGQRVPAGASRGSRRR